MQMRRECVLDLGNADLDLKMTKYEPHGRGYRYLEQRLRGFTTFQNLLKKHQVNYSSSVVCCAQMNLRCI